MPSLKPGSFSETSLPENTRLVPTFRLCNLRPGKCVRTRERGGVFANALFIAANSSRSRTSLPPPFKKKKKTPRDLEMFFKGKRQRSGWHEGEWSRTFHPSLRAVFVCRSAGAFQYHSLGTEKPQEDSRLLCTRSLTRYAKMCK